jgi:predicted O-methyltransferase YrrM
MTTTEGKLSSITLCWLRYLFRKPRMLRFYSRWRKSLKAEGFSPYDQFPWIVYEAIDWLESFLTRDMQVLEWGSGGSTIFFAKRVHSVVTIEHDPEWYSTLFHQLRQGDISNVRLVLCPPVESETGDEAYTSTDAAYRGLSFRSYTEAIDSYPDQFFDLVFVDGRARQACMRHAFIKIRPGGYLLLDNSDRPHYQNEKTLLSDWGRQEFYGPGPYNDYFWETTVWKRL